MELHGLVSRCLCLFGLYAACLAAICLVHCDATIVSQGKNSGRASFTKLHRKFHSFNKFGTDTYMTLVASNTYPYVSSPFSLPPYDSLPPFSMPANAPPYCVYPPPNTPQPPYSSPIGGYAPLPPPASSMPPPPGLPTIGPSPPSIVPNPPGNVPTPGAPTLNPPGAKPSPPYYEPSPPSSEPSPPFITPSPSEPIPSPRFLPPIVFPPPAVPPPPRRSPIMAQWCVAKAAVPDPIIQEAMNYACGSGADCDQIQPSGSCFQPDTLFSHASYAFNSYWQRTKRAGATCDFGGTAILVTVDPSYDGCHFIYF